MSEGEKKREKEGGVKEGDRERDGDQEGEQQRWREGRWRSERQRRGRMRSGINNSSEWDQEARWIKLMKNSHRGSPMRALEVRETDSVKAVAKA